MLQVAESPLTSLTLAAQRSGGYMSKKDARDGVKGMDGCFFFCWKVEGISFEGTFEKLLLIT